MTLDELAAELLVERYGPTGHAKRRLPVAHSLADGGPDTEISQARHRRDLCEALDDSAAVLERAGEVRAA